MKKFLCALGVAAVLAGGAAAADDPAAAPVATGPYQGATLTVLSYEKASFTSLTAGKAALGMFGGLMSIGDGDKIVTQHNIADPAAGIAARLAPVVAAKYGTANIVTLTGRNSDRNDPEDLAKAAGGTGLVLDVQTRGWRMSYFPLDWTHYRIGYTARARLTDARTGKEIARASCDYSSGDDTPAPTYDEMLADDAALLKAKLAAATELCVTTMGAELAK